MMVKTKLFLELLIASSIQYTVKKDVDILVAAGLLNIEGVPLPGHGRQKYVRAAADRIQLQAIVA